MGLDQVGGIKLFCAVVALVATGALEAAIGAGAFDVPVWQEAAIGLGVDLLFGDLADQTHVVQAPGKGLGQVAVLGRG